MHFVARIGRNDQIRTVERNGVRDVYGIAAMSEKPVVPFGAIERGAVEFVSPHEVITGWRIGGGIEDKE